MKTELDELAERFAIALLSGNQSSFSESALLATISFRYAEAFLKEQSARAEPPGPIPNWPDEQKPECDCIPLMGIGGKVHHKDCGILPKDPPEAPEPQGSEVPRCLCAGVHPIRGTSTAKIKHANPYCPYFEDLKAKALLKKMGDELDQERKWRVDAENNLTATVRERDEARRVARQAEAFKEHERKRAESGASMFLQLSKEYKDLQTILSKVSEERDKLAASIEEAQGEA